MPHRMRAKAAVMLWLFCTLMGGVARAIMVISLQTLHQYTNSGLISTLTVDNGFVIASTVQVSVTGALFLWLTYRVQGNDGNSNR